MLLLAPFGRSAAKMVATFLTCSQWLNCGGSREVRSDINMSATSVYHCFDHTLPTQTDDGISQIDHDIRAYVPYSFQTMSSVLLHPLHTEVQG